MFTLGDKFNVERPFKDWQKTILKPSKNNEHFNLNKLIAEAEKYACYSTLKRKLPKKWTIELRYDGYRSSTSYKNYLVHNKKITMLDIFKIKIDSTLSLVKAVGDLVFELSNAINSPFFERLDSYAIKNKIGRESYIKKTIRIEMEATYHLMKLGKEISEQNPSFNALKEFSIHHLIWEEFKRTLLPRSNANYIPKGSWLDHLTNAQYEDKSVIDHILYGQQYDVLRARGERGGFKK